jgi:transcription initiation factor TFIID subunit TAF12
LTPHEEDDLEDMSEYRPEQQQQQQQQQQQTASNYSLSRGSSRIRPSNNNTSVPTAITSSAGRRLPLRLEGDYLFGWKAMLSSALWTTTA